MDNDIDSLLLQQFSSMATQDRDVLIAEFQKFLGNQLNEASCAFYLDMNNWNLQDAICSYFEYHSEAALSRVHQLPQMSVVPDAVVAVGATAADTTSRDQPPTLVAPNASLSRVWHIVNTGNEVWPVGCSLRHIAGHQLSTVNQIVVDSLQPATGTKICLELVSPAVCGVYRSEWRMCTITGAYFGESLWVVVEVVADDTMISDSQTPADSLTLRCPHDSIAAAGFDDSLMANTFRIPTAVTSLALGPCLQTPTGDETLMNSSVNTSSQQGLVDTDNMDMS